VRAQVDFLHEHNFDPRLSQHDKMLAQEEEAAAARQREQRAAAVAEEEAAAEQEAAAAARFAEERRKVVELRQQLHKEREGSGDAAELLDAGDLLGAAAAEEERDGGAKTEAAPAAKARHFTCKKVLRHGREGALPLAAPVGSGRFGVVYKAMVEDNEEGRIPARGSYCAIKEVNLPAAGGVGPFAGGREAKLRKVREEVRCQVAEHSAPCPEWVRSPLWTAAPITCCAAAASSAVPPHRAGVHSRRVAQVKAMHPNVVRVYGSAVVSEPSPGGGQDGDSRDVFQIYLE
jgi:hypothetical protein